MIDTTCTAGQLREMMARTKRAWENYGASEPYASVLTSDLYKRDVFDLNSAGFWQSGEHDVAEFQAQVARAGIALNPELVALDYGCGVGRTLIPLTKLFREAVGFDKSMPHLEVAAVELAKRDLSPALLFDEPLPPYDVLFSVLVLQHNPPPVIAYTLNRLLSHLVPCGIAYFQIPTFRAGYSFKVAEYLADPKSGTLMETHGLPQSVVFGIAAENHCRPLEVRETGQSEFGASTFYLFWKGAA